MNLAAAQRVKVIAGEYSKNFQITVRNDYKVLQAIAITRQPSQTTFDFGQELNTAGITVSGTFYDTNSGGTTPGPITTFKTTGYNKTKRGPQTITVSANGFSDTYTVTVKVPASATIIYPLYRSDANESKTILHYLKGQPFKLLNHMLLKMTVNGLTVTLYANDLNPADFSGYSSTTVGTQVITLTLDDKIHTYNVTVLDAEPEVYFDYGYMRLPSDPTGIGAGAGKYYTRPAEPLTLSVARFLIGYDENSNATQVTYNWSVLQQAGPYTASAASGEYFTFTPSSTETYRIRASVTGRSVIDGTTITRTAETDVVCYTGTVATTKTFPENPGLRNVAPSQFAAGGTVLGWSCGAQGGYWVWRVPHQASYTIKGNAIGGWEEPGVIWLMEDNNNNNIPDEMWYELRGSMDSNPNWVTRRFAVRYYHAAGEIVNEYGQPRTGIPWVDSRGHSGTMSGVWPRMWGVSDDEDWVMYTGTNFALYVDNYPSGGNDTFPGYNGYVDVMERYYPEIEYSGNVFPISRAQKADGTPITLTNVRFIKVQTAKFSYGSIFGDISTEISNADGLGSTTNFPMP